MFSGLRCELAICPGRSPAGRLRLIRTLCAVGQCLLLPLARQLPESHLGRFAPELLDLQYGKEIWSIYQSGKLQPYTELSGRVARDNRPVNVGSVIREIDDVIKEAAAQRRYKQAMEQ